MDHGQIAARRREYATLLEQSLASLVDILKQREEVLRISVFGSYARGRRDLFTDLDVLVIMQTAAPFIERQCQLYQLLTLPVDLDLFCYTPDEFEITKFRPFLRHALMDEKVLYEKKPS
jgi:predicted nucleotidyltransferase